MGDASSLRAATPSCGFSRSSTHRAPWGVAPATPRTNRCVSCAAAVSSPSSSSSLWALTKLALSCGFSRSSTHRAPWGVAPATPRTNLCVISSSCLQALASIDLWLWSVSSAEWWLEPLLDTPSASPLGRGSSHAPNLPAVIVAAALGVHESECVCCWLVWSEYSTLTKKIQRLIRRPASTAPRL